MNPATKSIQAAITANTKALHANTSRNSQAAFRQPCNGYGSTWRWRQRCHRQRAADALSAWRNRTAGNLIRRKALGEWNRLKDIAAARFTNDLHRVANNMTMPEFRTFMQHYEGVGGKTIDQLPSGQKELAKALKAGYEDVRNKISSSAEI